MHNQKNQIPYVQLLETNEPVAVGRIKDLIQFTKRIGNSTESSRKKVRENKPKEIELSSDTEDKINETKQSEEIMKKKRRKINPDEEREMQKKKGYQSDDSRERERSRSSLSDLDNDAKKPERLNFDIEEKKEEKNQNDELMDEDVDRNEILIDKDPKTEAMELKWWFFEFQNDANKIFGVFHRILGFEKFVSTKTKDSANVIELIHESEEEREKILFENIQDRAASAEEKLLLCDYSGNFDHVMLNRYKFNDILEIKDIAAAASMFEFSSQLVREELNPIQFLQNIANMRCINAYSIINNRWADQNLKNEYETIIQNDIISIENLEFNVLVNPILIGIRLWLLIVRVFGKDSAFYNNITETICFSSNISNEILKKINNKIINGSELKGNEEVEIDHSKRNHILLLMEKFQTILSLLRKNICERVNGLRKPWNVNPLKIQSVFIYGISDVKRNIEMFTNEYKWKMYFMEFKVLIHDIIKIGEKIISSLEDINAEK
ncbi:hypothetical protein RFI_29289 [Reticulomyxa filosa]|uniref:Uncharacterized protein n=1 Tax=Reticulomyxa filosa TaxID=46433 RepID=X6M4Y8_RETFI|nr:hypothetical protein RFI_29289 [Reticulomyxa filosa]|eukprot:ETO08100.1 hypothetical protein RFI_29289 [Reticulomyxa filosa]